MVQGTVLMEMREILASTQEDLQKAAAESSCSLEAIPLNEKESCQTQRIEFEQFADDGVGKDDTLPSLSKLKCEDKQIFIDV